MANEKNTNEKAMETTETVAKLDFKKIVRDFIKDYAFPLVRSPFKSGDKEMFAYAIEDVLTIDTGDMVFDKPVKIDFEARDKGGYEVLDLLFQISKDPRLEIVERSMEDGTVYNEYTVWVTDKNGIPYDYKVKPIRESDKALLNALLRQKAFAAYTQNVAKSSKT